MNINGFEAKISRAAARLNMRTQTWVSADKVYFQLEEPAQKAQKKFEIGKAPSRQRGKL